MEESRAEQMDSGKISCGSDKVWAACLEKVYLCACVASWVCRGRGRASWGPRLSLTFELMGNGPSPPPPLTIATSEMDLGPGRYVYRNRFTIWVSVEGREHVSHRHSALGAYQ